MANGDTTPTLETQGQHPGNVDVGTTQDVAAGTFVRAAGDDTVFQVQEGGGLGEGFATPEDLFAAGGRHEDVQLFKVGQNISAGGQLFNVQQGGGFVAGTVDSNFEVQVPEDIEAAAVVEGTDTSDLEFAGTVDTAIDDFNKIDEAIKGSDDIVKMTEDTDAAKDALDQSIKDLKTSFEEKGFEDITTEVLEEYKIKELSEDVSAKRLELANEEKRELEEIEKATGKIASASFIRGRVGRVRRDFAVIKGGIALQLNALAQNLQAAQSIANTIISAKTADLQAERNFLTAMVNVNQGLWQELKADERQAVTDRFNFITAEIDRKREDARQVLDLMIQAPGANINPNMSVEEATKNAATWLNAKATKDIDLSFVADMRLNYPDANIAITDTAQDAARKLQDSNVWKTEQSAAKAKVALLQAQAAAAIARADGRDEDGVTLKDFGFSDAERASVVQKMREERALGTPIPEIKGGIESIYPQIPESLMQELSLEAFGEDAIITPDQITGEELAPIIARDFVQGIIDDTVNIVSSGRKQVLTTPNIFTFKKDVPFSEQIRGQDTEGADAPSILFIETDDPQLPQRVTREDIVNAVKTLPPDITGLGAPLARYMSDDEIINLIYKEMLPDGFEVSVLGLTS